MENNRVENPSPSPFPNRFPYRSTAGDHGLPRQPFTVAEEDPFKEHPGDKMFADFDDNFKRSFMNLKGPRPKFFEEDPFFSDFPTTQNRHHPTAASDDDAFFQRFNQRMPSMYSSTVPGEDPWNGRKKFPYQESADSNPKRPQERFHPAGLHRSYTQPSNDPFFQQRSASESPQSRKFQQPQQQQQTNSETPQQQSQQQSQKGAKVRVIPVQHEQSRQQQKAPMTTFVEVNNSNPTAQSEQQQRFNPDKKMRYQSPNKDSQHRPGEAQRQPPVIIVDDYSHRRDSAASPRAKSSAERTGPVSPAISEQAIPLPAPAIPMPPPPEMAIPMPSPEEVHSDIHIHQQEEDSQRKDIRSDGIEMNSPEIAKNHQKSNQNEQETDSSMDVMVTTVVVDDQQKGAQQKERLQQKKRFVPLASSIEQLIQIMDKTEIRVEQLRDTAAQLEQEKIDLLEALDSIIMTGKSIQLETHELDELHLVADRVLKRCRAVDVSVNTPRDPEQIKALEEVNGWIQMVVDSVPEDPERAKNTLDRFLNACCPDEPTGPIDQRFQTKIVSCTADDQKKIRRRLFQLINQI